MENGTCEASDVVLRWINYLVPALVLMIGLVTNTLSLWILTRHNMQTTSMKVLLCILVGADNICLMVGLLPYWMKHAFDFDLRTKTLVTCRMFKFLITYSTDFSNWILVAINIDRCISVAFHQTWVKYCTKRHVSLYVVILAIILLIVNGHLLGHMELQSTILWGFMCIGRNNFVRFVWPWIDLCIYCLVPSSIMIICNIIIITAVVKSRRKVLSNTTASSIPEPSSSSATNNFRVRSRNRITTLTRTLFGLDLTFILLTSPIVIYLIYESYITIDLSKLSITKKTHYFLSIANILEFANHSIHFFIYGITIPKFRHKFFTIIRWKRK